MFVYNSSDKRLIYTMQSTGKETTKNSNILKEGGYWTISKKYKSQKLYEEILHITNLENENQDTETSPHIKQCHSWQRTTIRVDEDVGEKGPTFFVGRNVDWSNFFRI